jgi:hypothetical protein
MPSTTPPDKLTTRHPRSRGVARHDLVSSPFDGAATSHPDRKSPPTPQVTA